MNEIELAKQFYDSAPLNRFRNFKDLKVNIDELTIDQKLNLLFYSFQNYDNEYNKELCLSHPNLWREFKEVDWKKLVLKMFPRKVKYEKGNLKEINTGAYCDIFLLNGIILVSLFEFIFQEPKLEDAEKKSFMNYLKFYGETCFYCNERELIEDIVNFYELEVFLDIVKMKDYLLTNSSFKSSKRHNELLNQLTYPKDSQ